MVGGVVSVAAEFSAMLFCAKLTATGSVEREHGRVVRCALVVQRSIWQRTVRGNRRLHRQVKHLERSVNNHNRGEARGCGLACDARSYVAVVHVPAGLRRQEGVPRLLSVSGVWARSLDLVDVHTSCHGLCRLHSVLCSRDDGPATLPDGPAVRDVVVTGVLRSIMREQGASCQVLWLAPLRSQHATSNASGNAQQ